MNNSLYLVGSGARERGGGAWRQREGVVVMVNGNYILPRPPLLRPLLVIRLKNNHFL
jgi:hypothetical protein